MASLDNANEPVAELVTYHCKECYVYVPLPPATTYGHRAELWNVDKWFKAVQLRVVSCRDDLYVKLEDQDTGELFAECPLPNDGTSLTTAVDPVVDSSRYFVVKVVDSATPKKHAFIGVGFRDRNEASNFTAALDDYRQYLRRLKEAEQMRQQYSQAEEEDGNEASSGSSSRAGPSRDLSLKEPVKLTLNTSGSKGKSLERLLQKSLSVGTHEVGGVVLLQPPPPSGACGSTSTTGSSSKSAADRTSSRDGLPGSPPAVVSNPGTPSGVKQPEALESGFRQLALEPRTSSERVGGGKGDGVRGAGAEDWGDFVG